MRLPIIAIAVLFLAGLIIDAGITGLLRRNYRRRAAARIYAWSCILFYLLLLTAVSLPRRNPEFSILPAMWMLYTWLSCYVAKIIYLIFAAAGTFLPLLFGKKDGIPLGKWVGLPLGLAAMGAMWWGACVTRHKIEVNHQQVNSEYLPENFDGYKIAHFSDIHLGTWGTDTVFISRMVDSINSLKPDVILFTGDIVNVRASEMIPFMKPLSRLNAPGGVYSVLGNHDYGDYASWQSPESKDANLALMHDLQKKMGWKLLDNRHEFLKRGEDSIALIGVGNWGEPPFRTYGDISRAYPREGLRDANFKILLTHNPRHWDLETFNISNIDLTLSGHTHAMQIVFKTRDRKWSPACWKYPQWGGLYATTANGRPVYLNVNIGLGEVGLPFRIGATPEISLITLRKR